uniref:tRNA pseudouridine synthase n=1 Tax=Astatotilapia calliptera TaxID=8154 RepID=A0AAX7UAH7_ASTCA
MHNRARYLIFFQYIGTKYRGAVKVPPHQLGKKGVQDHLEDAIQRLRPVNPVSLSVSSRTDTGVHALSNSAHFDLQRKNDKLPFTEDVLVQALNFHLGTEQIRITRAHRVPHDFHARFRAQSRTYVYRIALGISHHSLLPLTDWDLCWSLRNTELNVDAMHEAASLLLGTHDFSSFRAVNSDLPFKNPVKTMDVISIQQGNSFAYAHFHRCCYTVDQSLMALFCSHVSISSDKSPTLLAEMLTQTMTEPPLYFADGFRHSLLYFTSDFLLRTCCQQFEQVMTNLD